MGLTSISGGGRPAFGSTVLSTGNGFSTTPPHRFGTRAHDSSGGIYILGRGTGSTTQKQGCLVVLDSSAGIGEAVLPTAAGVTSTAGGTLGVTAGGSPTSTVGVSTSQYVWYQVYGPGIALAETTTITSGRLWLSSAVLGAVLDSSGGDIGQPGAISGLVATSSNASSIINVFLNYPHIPSIV